MPCLKEVCTKTVDSVEGGPLIGLKLRQKWWTISFRFAYFCHPFPVNKYPRNSPTRTQQFDVLDNKSLIRRFSCVVSLTIFTRCLYFDSLYWLVKYGTTLKNTQRYHTTKRLIRYNISQFSKLLVLRKIITSIGARSEQLSASYDVGDFRPKWRLSLI